MFSEKLENTMEVYIEDMLVKSFRAENHVDNLQRCFAVLNKYDMKLNLENVFS